MCRCPAVNGGDTESGGGDAEFEDGDVVFDGDDADVGPRWTSRVLPPRVASSSSSLFSVGFVGGFDEGVMGWRICNSCMDAIARSRSFRRTG